MWRCACFCAQMAFSEWRRFIRLEFRRGLERVALGELRVTACANASESAPALPSAAASVTASPLAATSGTPAPSADPRTRPSYPAGTVPTMPRAAATWLPDVARRDLGARPRVFSSADAEMWRTRKNCAPPALPVQSACADGACEPAFFMVSAQKAATSSFFMLLSRHPNISLGMKENDFFFSDATG
jgi:hypothetical protein